MGRRRINQADNKLPERVYKNKYSYVYQPKDGKKITLCPLSASMSELWAKYNNEIAKTHYKLTFSKLWALFLDSAYFADLAPRTQKDYHQHSKKLLKVFGNVDPDRIKPEDVWKYLDLRGKQSRTQANHEKASMSRVYSWGYERGYVKANPCAGVSKLKVVSRDIYADDKEYYAMLEVARPAVKIAMEIAYLCAVRNGDILKLTHEQISEEGIYVKQGKTGTRQIKLWTDRLRSIIDFAKLHFPPVTKKSPLILNSMGKAYSYKNFNEHWNEDKKKAEEKLGYKINFTFHDLKAKGISDYDGATKDKQLFSGHKTESQVLVYDRKVKKSPTLNIPKVTN
ncbi:integrase [Gilliamella sp. Fer2-1]|nr:integrase [Gilliamella apicola]